jgi:D-serine deaminase-like pyridoxal phosphate-dependent protein
METAGLTKHEIPTPALIVDLDAFERNVRKMAAHAARTGRRLRPHAKTHKCPEVARRQIAAGAVGVCVATVSEAEAMAAAGVGEILLSSPVVDPRKVARLVRLVQRGGRLMVSVGHALEAELLSEAVISARIELDVLVDLDVGDKRTGVLPGEPALQLARQLARCANLHVRGVQAYAGHASHTVGFAERQRVSAKAIGQAVETRRLFERSGIEAGILSGGSTGTYNIDSEIEGFTELQVGSYVFMDVDYRRIGGQDGGAIYSDFEPSLTVLTSVVSATHAERVTVDAGTKALDATTAHKPEAKNHRGLVYTKAGDEFGAVSVEADGELPKLGERLEFIVPHCDPNVNLYDRIYACRGDRVEATWPIAARRGD